jgi:hypothetical protein
MRVIGRRLVEELLFGRALQVVVRHLLLLLLPAVLLRGQDLALDWFRTVGSVLGTD